MSASSVIGFSENIPAMTFDEGLAFIERTRRQLDRFDVAIPGAKGKHISPVFETRIRTILNELEADINNSLGTI